VIACMWFLWVE